MRLSESASAVVMGLARIGAVLAGMLLGGSPAQACGCFTPPGPAYPVIQAGERIVFAVKNGEVTAHIQIQYSGRADSFGWLLPLPSEPKMELGSEELFDRIAAATEPSYRLTTIRELCGGGSTSSTARSGGGGCGFADSAASFSGGSYDAATGAAGDLGSSPLVVQDSIGPYDYAVLKADDKTAMLDWLNANRYYVPGANSTVVDNYIHPGAFFLALKLHPGESAGAIQPVIVHYKSDLPMIPLVLTSVGAVPNMGILVWVLGPSRAISRNFHDTVLDEAAYAWTGAVSNYDSLVIRAVAEAPKHHTFVTEYAGSTQPMLGVLDPPGRFGSLETLRRISDPVEYVSYLAGHGFPFQQPLYGLLQQFIPPTPKVLADRISPDDYYRSLRYYLTAWYQLHGDGGAGGMCGDAGTSFDGGDGGSGIGDGGCMPPWDFTFDPIGLTDAIETRIVNPLLAAGALFRENQKMTRFITALSPADMTADPVFSYNPDLPDVGRDHVATIDYPCGGTPWLATSEGFELQYPNGFATSLLGTLPASRFIRTLAEAGPPVIVTDNHDAIAGTLRAVDKSSPGGSGDGGCRMTRGALRRGDLVLVVMGGLLLAGRRAWRRRSRTRS